MNATLKNSIAVVLGLLLGAAVNMGIIMISGSVIPPPEGADVTTTEGLKASIHLFEAKHFIFPFLAHALGTLIGAFIVAKLARSHKMAFALVIGAVFFVGGLMMVLSVPSPAWFNTLDLVVAYIPMAWIGAKIAR